MEAFSLSYFLRLEPGGLFIVSKAVMPMKKKGCCGKGVKMYLSRNTRSPSMLLSRGWDTFFH